MQGTLWRGAISPKSARDNDSGIAVDDVMSPVTVAKEECHTWNLGNMFFFLGRFLANPWDCLKVKHICLTCNA